MHFGVLNYEKQHKEGTCKVSGRSIVFSAFDADFCLCPKLVIITTLTVHSEHKGTNPTKQNITGKNELLFFKLMVACLVALRQLWSCRDGQLT